MRQASGDVFARDDSALFAVILSEAKDLHIFLKSITMQRRIPDWYVLCNGRGEDYGLPSTLFSQSPSIHSRRCNTASQFPGMALYP